jgi:hypothetical protein
MVWLWALCPIVDRKGDEAGEVDLVDKSIIHSRAGYPEDKYRTKREGRRWIGPQYPNIRVRINKGRRKASPTRQKGQREKAILEARLAEMSRLVESHLPGIPGLSGHFKRSIHVMGIQVR